MVNDQLEPMPEDWQRGLAIVAHPDDLEYGASGAVAAWTAGGREVAYVLVTRGEAGIDGMDPAEAAPVREAEQHASAAAVGVTTVEFLDGHDGTLEYGVALRRDLARVIRKHRPELVITLNYHDSWGGRSWNSADHRAVGRAVLDAVDDAGNRWIFPELVDEGLLPWGGVRWVAVYGSPNATHAVDVSETYEQAVASLAAHKAYLSGLAGGDPEEQARAVLEQTTAMAADRFGGRPTAAFELIGE